MKFIPASRASKTLLSLAAVAAVGTIGVAGTNALLTDTVTMQAVSTSGGNINLVATGPDAFTLPTNAFTNMKPGESRTATVNLSNTGSLALNATATVAGTDTSSCFTYALSGNSSTIPATTFGAGTTAASIGALDAGHDADFTLTITENSSCTVGSLGAAGPSGTLNVTFAATQA